MTLDPITVVLVGCGKTKLARRARAKNLYTGTLFRSARRYAESCDEWRILSAKFGLLPPEMRIDPYDIRLRPKDRQQWGQNVANRLVGEFLECGPYEVIILAGSDYAEPVRDGMRVKEGGWRCNCVGVSVPMEGMGIGARMQWLTRAMKESESEAAR